MVKATRYIIRPLFVVFTLIGAIFVFVTSYDAFIGDDYCPEFAPASAAVKRDANESRTTYLWSKDTPFHDDAYWGALGLSLDILDDINPSVSAWVRERNIAGKLVFVGNISEMAKYDYFSGKLTISHAFFTESEKKKVAIISHEYRHSHQNFAKVARYILSHSFGGRGKTEIVENDAYLYEREAEAAFATP